MATSPDLVLTRINSSMLELNRDLSDKRLNTEPINVYDEKGTDFQSVNKSYMRDCINTGFEAPRMSSDKFSSIIR